MLSNERTFILKIDFTDNSKNFRLIFFPAKTSTWWQRIDSGICILQYFLFKPRFCLSVVKIQWHNAIKDPCIWESLCIFYSILWLNIRLIKGALKGFQCSALYSLWCMPDTTERQIFKHIKKKKNWTPAFEYSFLSIKKKRRIKTIHPSELSMYASKSSHKRLKTTEQSPTIESWTAFISLLITGQMEQFTWTGWIKCMF